MAAASDNEHPFTLGKMTVLLLALVTFILWAIAAAMYQTEHGDLNAGRFRGRGVAGQLVTMAVRLTWNAIISIPEFFQVMGYVFQERFTFVIVAIVIEALLVLFLLWMRRVDQDLKHGNPFRKRRK
jgi:hypothetical protein